MRECVFIGAGSESLMSHCNFLKNTLQVERNAQSPDKRGTRAFAASIRSLRGSRKGVTLAGHQRSCESRTEAAGRS